MKILFTGGHLTPALAVIDYLQEHFPADQVIFVGREFAQRATQQPSQERGEIEQRGIPFIPFETGKLHRWHLGDLIKEVRLLFQGLTKARTILQEHEPDCVMSFGGYLAVPFALQAWLLNIPVITHEQTRSAGVANRVIALFAKKIAISFPESAGAFPHHKTVLTGNPIRQDLLQPRSTQPEWIHKVPEQKLLYIAGGSQGSLTINTLITEILPELLQDWWVIHQCGAPHHHKNAWQELSAFRLTLPVELRPRYFVREWLNESELHWVYRHVDLIVSRSGANTVQEIVLAGKPAIFIPLPLTHDDEQTKNATVAAQNGSAIVLPQATLDAPTLLSTITKCHRRLPHLSELAERNRTMFVTNADEQLAALIHEGEKKAS